MRQLAAEERIAERATGGRGKRIVLATWGSFGDLHPFIALGLGLKARGHRPVIASASWYRPKIEGEGLEFHPMRPEMASEEEAPEIVARAMDPNQGAGVVINELLMPHIRDQYADLLAVVRDADLLVNHPIVHTGPLVCEKLGKPWVDAILQPMLFTSSYEPPVPPQMPGFAALYRLGPAFNRWLMRLVKQRHRQWSVPIDQLRAELGLPPGPCAVFEAHFSPLLNLALFSRALGEPQPDWPAHTVVCGFPFYDKWDATSGMPEELEAFLQAGPPPITFTLGSSAVFAGGSFYRDSVEAARRLGRRAVLLAGREGMNDLPNPLPEGMIAVVYAPHSQLFARSCAVVHQGGAGTTGQAMRAGKPTLIVPYAHDQPDNAVRVTRRGGARWVVRARYNADTAERELRELLTRPEYAAKAEETARLVRSEDGVATACEAIEAVLARHNPS